MDRYSEYKSDVKTGGAYTGWRPTEPMPRLLQWLVGITVSAMLAFVLFVMVMS